MRKTIISVGDRFGKLVTVKELPNEAWICLCDCGNEKLSKRRSLMHGDTKSCGCLIKENSHRTHGYARNGKTKTYKIWTGIIKRGRKCDGAYASVNVCERWHKFENFLSDMGDVPPNCSIDRINTMGNYEPSNCRWATATEQARNRTITRRLTFQGNTKTIQEWANDTGIKYSTIHRRIFLGWSAEMALLTPVLTLHQASIIGAHSKKRATHQTFCQRVLTTERQ